MTAVTALEVVALASGETVHRIDLRPGIDPDRVTAGLLRNMDTDHYAVREVSA